MMCAAWLPHLKSKPKASVVNVSSGLAFVPLTRCPAYCATKVQQPFHHTLLVQSERIVA